MKLRMEAIAVVVVLVCGSAEAGAAWKPVNTLNNAVGVQNSKLCSHRLVFRSSLPPHSSIWLEPARTYEDYTANGALQTQSFSFWTQPLDEAGFHHVLSGPNRDLYRQLQAVPDQKPFDASILLINHPTQVAVFYFHYLTNPALPADPSNWTYITVPLDASRFTLEKNCR